MLYTMRGQFETSHACSSYMCMVSVSESDASYQSRKYMSYRVYIVEHSHKKVHSVSVIVLSEPIEDDPSSSRRCCMFSWKCTSVRMVPLARLARKGQIKPNC